MCVCREEGGWRRGTSDEPNSWRDSRRDDFDRGERRDLRDRRDDRDRDRDHRPAQRDHDDGEALVDILSPCNPKPVCLRALVFKTACRVRRDSGGSWRRGEDRREDRKDDCEAPPRPRERDGERSSWRTEKEKDNPRRTKNETDDDGWTTVRR